MNEQLSNKEQTTPREIHWAQSWKYHKALLTILSKVPFKLNSISGYCVSEMEWGGWVCFCFLLLLYVVEVVCYWCLSGWFFIFQFQSTDWDFIAVSFFK